MSNKIEEIISYSSESHLLDFKSEQYLLGKNPKKYELLKDISSMANHPSNEDKYIIIGVSEKNGVACEFNSLENIEDEAKYQQFMISNIEPEISFEYKSIYYKGYKLAYFRIFDNNDRPYLFKKDILDQDKKVINQQGIGYIRVGTSTRKIVREDFDRIYQNKFTQPDRKLDLIVWCDMAEKVFEFSDYKKRVKYIDVSIENISNKSILFEIEMKVFTDDNFHVYSAEEIRKAINKLEYSKALSRNKYAIHTPTFTFMTRVFFKKKENFILITRATRVGINTKEISIPQNDIKQNVFLEEVIVQNNGLNTIVNVEVIIRSDDFVSGLLIKKFALNLT